MRSFRPIIKRATTEAPKMIITDYMVICDTHKREQEVLPLIHDLYSEKTQQRSHWSQWSLASYLLCTSITEEHGIL